MKYKLLLTLLTLLAIGSHSNAQVLASFSFSQNSTAGYGWSDAGWTNVFGDPYTGVRSATANGITISSISTSNWVTNNSACAEDAISVSGQTYFPEHIMRCHWYQASNSNTAEYSQGYPQFRISGLNKDSFYILRMSACNAFGPYGDPTQYTVAGLTVAPSQNMYPYNNLSTGVTFQHIYPDTSGNIYVYVNTTPGKNVAYIAGIQVISGSSTVGIPVVNITSPDNNDVLAEESSITINATATETGGTISKVEFFIDTTKIGEDFTAPYTCTWNNPDAGHYTIKAKATDNTNTTGMASINVSIESLSSFWSMTGNIAANADSNFLGTVDTNRLAFRTNNIERMSILKDGSIGIGTKNTYGYKLAVNGTAIFTKVRIKTAGNWPDYVFKKGYKLPDLQELEHYITAHKHLPGIVSEGEVGRNGFDMGDHQAALLKKVEELTLYLIDENKKLREQNERLLQQQREIDELKKLIRKK